MDSLLPDEEKTALLFHGEPPLHLPTAEFKELIGSVKYHQYLNYFYGITVEEALILAMQDEVRKERWTAGLGREKDTTNEVYRRIYGATKTALLRRFRQDKAYPQLNTTNLTELKEFTYWLFQHQLKQCDKTRVASDTTKALKWLKEKGFSNQPDKDDFKLAYIDISLTASEG